MTRIAKTLLESTAVLLVGFAIIGSLMFAFSQNVEAKNGTAQSVGSGLTVSIGDDGRALVRGAEVTAVSGGTLTAKTSWGSSALTWTVRTDGDTDFVRKNGSGTALGDIATGDIVSFSGMLDEDANAFTVDADAVKNWSKDDAKTVYTGTVTSVNDDNDTFVLSTKQNGSITVRVSGDTAYGSSNDFSDVDVNDTAVVSGSLAGGTLTASKISLNMKAEVNGEAKGNWKDWAKNIPLLNWFGNKGHK